jgi:hypothetical protein
MWPTWFKNSDKTKSGQSGKSTAEELTGLPLAAHLRSEAKRVWVLRKREFDKLRELRKNLTDSDDKPKQRFFHTSRLTDLSEKSSTLKKIDEIEAQMSMQWWKTEVLDTTHRKKTP